MQIKKVKVAINDSPDLVDPVFVGLPKGCSAESDGWVEMTWIPLEARQ